MTGRRVVSKMRRRANKSFMTCDEANLGRERGVLIFECTLLIMNLVWISSTGKNTEAESIQ